MVIILNREELQRHTVEDILIALVAIKTGKHQSLAAIFDQQEILLSCKE